MQRAIGDLQSSMANFRAEYPEIMRYSAQWIEHEFAMLYGRVESPDAAVIIQFYSYVDIGLEFCNTTLAASASRLISVEVFERHYRPLIWLFLAENYPYISRSINGPYLSSYVKDEWQTAERGGWDWHLRHRQVGEEPQSPESPDPGAAV